MRCGRGGNIGAILKDICAAGFKIVGLDLQDMDLDGNFRLTFKFPKPL
jgi:nucleoside diphosphate kinase